MEERKLTTWNEYKIFIDDIRKRLGSFEPPTTIEGWTAKYENRILFRGQPNKPLQTSLERASKSEFTLSSYLRLIDRIIPEIESHTGIKWEFPEGKNKKTSDEEQLSVSLNFQEEFRFPAGYYSYAIYLRQHGYPSPLLDWTISPYIAAYFALYNRPKENDDFVAVYAYIEIPELVKAVYNPRISVLGPYTSTHKRHFAQKSWYTVSAKWEEEKSDYIFCSHHDIFDSPPKKYDPKQDYLVKIMIPTRERSVALRELDNDYNINHFTLFQTEDSLIETLSMRDFEHYPSVIFKPPKRNKSVHE